jgi:hypothetical protein
MNTRLGTTQDLNDASSPEEIAYILRNAADSCYEADNELMAAWGQKSTPWAKVARILERAAEQIEKATT